MLLPSPTFKTQKETVFAANQPYALGWGGVKRGVADPSRPQKWGLLKYIVLSNIHLSGGSAEITGVGEDTNVQQWLTQRTSTATSAKQRLH